MAGGELSRELQYCPSCNEMLDLEPFADRGRLTIAYTCQRHGVVSLHDPFAG
jgi:hypothetical protein